MSAVVPLKSPKPEPTLWVILAGGLFTPCRTEEAARSEAKRLAELDPGRPVTVFRPAFEVRASMGTEMREL